MKHVFLLLCMLAASSFAMPVFAADASMDSPIEVLDDAMKTGKNSKHKDSDKAEKIEKKEKKKYRKKSRKSHR